MICPSCSTVNREDANFCKKCGYSFRSTQGKASDMPENLQGAAIPENQNQTSENSQAQTSPANAPQQVNSAAGSAPAMEAPAAAEEPLRQDPTFAPTEVVSHEQMAAYHARRVQQEEQVQQPGRWQASPLPSSTQDPTAGRGDGEHHPEAEQTDADQSTDIADMPTIVMNPSSNEWPEPVPPSSTPSTRNDENIPIPPPPPPSSLPPTAIAATSDFQQGPPVNRDEQNREAGAAVGATQTDQNAVEEQKLAATIAASQHTTPAADVSADTNASAEDEMITRNEDRVTQTPIDQQDQPAEQAVEEQGNGEQASSLPSNEPGRWRASPLPSSSPGPADQTDQTEGSNDFPVLAVGTLVNNRYEVTGVLSDDLQEHTYHVNDHQGYQHCWNCGSEQNSEGDEFCIDCGAELLNAAYILHEYPATNSSNTEGILQGAIVNTFVENGHTYVVEQEHAEQNAFPNGVHLLVAADSDAGDIRRSEPNEDSVLVLTFQRIHESMSTPAGVFIVADGMGGHDNGQLASHMAITTIAERMTRDLLLAPLTAEKNGEEVKPFDENALVSLLQGAVEDANASICQVNSQNKTDMGSTITGFMIVGDHAYILNVGDSRTYMVRGGQIYQLTNDHSLVGQLVAGGLIQPDDVYTHPQRSQIFRSLGDKLNVQIDIFKQQLHPGDILLSCCDGLWEMVRNPEIENIVNNAPDPQAACKQLLDAANANGGEDNISAVVAFVH